MGQTFSSPRPRPAASGAGLDGLPTSNTTNPPRARSAVEIPAPIIIQAPPRHEREAVRGGEEEQTGSGPSMPDSARAGLSPPLSDNDANITVTSDTDGSQTLHQGGFDHRRFSRSSSATLDIEVVHPKTGTAVFRRGSVYNRPALKIVDRDLIDALCGSGARSVDTPIYERTFLSLTAHIHAPYEVLFYSREKIVMAAKTEVEPAKSHAQLLLNFMEKELTDTWNKCLEIDNRECKEIAFDKSWLLYRPEETVFRRGAGGWRAYKVARIETGARPGVDPISIFAYYLGFDKTGKLLVPHPETLTVKPYPSEQAIGSLELVPEWYVEKYLSGLFVELKARGALYWEYRGKPFYREYKGDAWATTLSNNSSKVIIDHATSSMHDKDQTLARPDSSPCLVCLAGAVKLGPWAGDSVALSHDPDVCTRKPVPVEPRTNEIGRLLIYCPPTVWAFSLDHMTWEAVLLKDLHDIEPDKASWGRLLMGEEPKSTLDLMFSAYFREWKAKHKRRDRVPSAGSSPFRSGFGRNILLHGGTGTGKTFTAECLAEKYGRPLYRVACGNLGTEPSDLEPQLRRTLLRAANWGAILLLENADLFVQDRDLHHLQRGALISILLNRLDHSEAFVILATSYPAKHDKGLLSRIHLPLYFESLTFGHQETIWRKLLENSNLNRTSRAHCISFIEETLKELDDGIHKNMNGRQIRNCLSAALALAKIEQSDDGEKVDLTEDHIKRVLRLGVEFRKQMETRRDVNPLNWMKTGPDGS